MEQFELFEREKITAEQMFQAYYDCRKNKRNTQQALEFECDLENNLITLLEEINSGTYEIGQSIAFVIDKPVKREIFAACFRDRIVHHLIYNLINPTLERKLIYDCYSCRVGKGTYLGIKRADYFIRSATNNYQKNAWIMKLDIKGFFMSIDKKVLYSNLRRHLIDNYHENTLEIILELCEKIIFNDPTQNCKFRCSKEKWKGLDKTKSLFTAKKGCGIPIGNLTSQMFGNFYMSSLDHFIKHDLGIKHYGRYVDDMVLIHEDKEYLLHCRDEITKFLQKELHLKLSPKKQYLQPSGHGMKFLGTDIKCGHINLSSRVIHNFSDKVRKINQLVEDHKPKHKELKKIESSLNSYLGMGKHYSTFRMNSAFASKLDPRLFKYLNRLQLLYSEAYGCLDGDVTCV